MDARLYAQTYVVLLLLLLADLPEILSIAILAIKVINLVLWVRSPVTSYSVAAASVTFAGTIGLVVLVFLEHSRSKRPSSIISVHLLAQIVAESCILRTLELRSYAPALVKTTWASIFLQLAMLALESTSKRSYLKNPGEYGVEETAGIFDRSVVWWLNRLFWRGNRGVLNQSDLFQLDSDLKSQRLREGIVLDWDQSRISSLYRCLSLP
jgi:ATP-binding cassette subfamily C (CFTR/MRP) protein 1